MQRRPAAIVERDYRLIKKYVDSHPNIKSLKEISTALGLTESMVITSLSHHPRVYKNLKERINSNKEEALKSAAEEAKKLTQTYVIDASITGFIEVFSLINVMLKESSIILTNVTIRELEKLQKYTDTPGHNARRLLAMAAGNEKFICVKIKENQVTADMNIVCYCAENKDTTTLVTADKTMALYARSLDVKVRFLSNGPKVVSTSKASSSKNSTTKVSTTKVSTPVEKQHEVTKMNVPHSLKVDTLDIAAFKFGKLLVILAFPILVNS